MRDRYFNNRMSVQFHSQSEMIMLQSQCLGKFTIVQANQQKTKELSCEQWGIILNNKSFVGFSNSRIHFSFLKGLPNHLRWNIWMFLANIDPSESAETYISLTTNIYKVPQIEVDVPRTMANKQDNDKFSGALRRILYAAYRLKIQYVQGMNFIIQHLIMFCCKSLKIFDQPLSNPVIEYQILKVFMFIVKSLDLAFGSDQMGIFNLISNLQQKICEYVPQILFQIAKFQFDCMTLFNQNYYTLMLYNNPPQSFALSLLDLFFLQGIKAIDTIIIRMIESCKDQLLQSKDAYQFQIFIKKDIFNKCAQRLDEQRTKAKSIKDFKLSFYQVQKV